MSLQKILRDFVKVVSDEAERNPPFADRLQDVFQSAMTPRTEKRNLGSGGAASKAKRPSNRRPPAVLDPISLAKQGEEALRTQLAPLTIEQLKDVVADYGMDPRKLVMKWKKPERIINEIVEISISRAHKGDAFRY